MENIEYLPLHLRQAIKIFAQIKNDKEIKDGLVSIQFSDDVANACEVGEYALCNLLMKHVNKFDVDDEIKKDFMIARVADIERTPIVFFQVPDGEGNEFKLASG
jgi:hypothetical protein